jgi:cell wall-associated NlpC family hydrolase
MKPNFLRFFAVAFAIILTGAGCQSTQQDTSTGLPYWPPTLSPASANQAALGQPAAGGLTGMPTVGQPSAWREAATRWLGVPYKEGGHDRRGVDCSGFSDILYREVVGRGIARTSRGQWLEGKPIDVQNVQPGDLVFFQTTGEQVSHVAVSMGGQEFAHASTSKGVMFSSLSDTYWSQRIVGARRMSP